MNKLFKNIALCGCVLAGMGMASCEDFLTITPTSSIVEEEFWKDKKDLENAVYACYMRMTNSDVLNKYIYWGEMRSDNFERGAGSSSTGQVANIMNANLLSTYNIYSWTNVYTVINYCNKVLAHGPEVLSSDESFSKSDWDPIRAEMIALRALNHFYLVRTYGEIPYVTHDYNNDSEELRQTQVTQLTVLDSLVNDLESVKDDAMTNYGNTVLNKGRMTKQAVYALLADVYLWRASYKAGNCHPFINRALPSVNTYYNGAIPYVEDKYTTTAADDYQKCIECCDKVISMATDAYIKKMKESGTVIGGEIEFELSDLLIQNVTENGTLASQSAYTKLWGNTGNSDESIFELQFDGTNYGNSSITELFYNISDSKQAAFAATSGLIESVEQTPNTTNPTSIWTKTDYRMSECLENTNSGKFSGTIKKFINRSITQSKTKQQTTSPMEDVMTTNKSYVSQVQRSNSNLDCNWIIYRMSEIFLMKAEAMSQIYTDKENLKTAFDYVREVFKRSNPFAYSKTNNTAKNDSLEFTGNFETPKNLETLIMSERQREFFGEGKRWFDLVRYAQRRGSTEDMLVLLTRKYPNGRKSIQAKLADMQSLFAPVYNVELKNNTWLYQNGVWEDGKSSGRTDNL